MLQDIRVLQAVPQQRRYHMLGTYLRRDVQHSAHSPRREAFDWSAHRGRFGTWDDPAVCGPVNLPHRRCQELGSLYSESDRADPRNRCGWRMVLPACF